MVGQIENNTSEILDMKTNISKIAQTNYINLSQSAIICSKSTKETLEQGVKYVQS